MSSVFRDKYKVIKGNALFSVEKGVRAYPDQNV